MGRMGICGNILMYSWCKDKAKMRGMCANPPKEMHDTDFLLRAAKRIEPLQKNSEKGC